MSRADEQLVIRIGHDGRIVSAGEDAIARFGGELLEGKTLGDLLTSEGASAAWRSNGSPFQADVLATASNGQISIALSETGPADQAPSRHRRDDLLRITADIVRADSLKIDENITGALGRIGRLTGVDRAYIFQFDGSGRSASNTHEWTRAGRVPQIVSLQNIDRDAFDWFEEAIEQEGYLLLNSLDDVPENKPRSREILSAQGISSLLAIGMFREGKLSGFVGFDAVSRPVRWSTRTVERLTLVAELFTQALLRAETELELEAANETFDLVRHATDDVIWDWNLETDRVWHSEALENLLGFSPNEETTRGDWWLERIHPEDRDEAVALLYDCPGIHCESQYRVRHRDGYWIHVLDRWQVSRDESGRPKRIVGITTDITRRVEDAERLRQSEARFRAVVENAHDVIAILDESGTIIYESPASLKTFGYAPEELEGTSVFAPVHPDDRDRVVRLFEEAIREGRPMGHTTFRARHGLGHWIDIETIGVNLLDVEEINGVVIVSRDVTGRRRMEQQLERTNRLASLGHLASGIAHEFNNVLMAMQPFTDLILRTDELKSIKTAARRINAAIDRGKSITRGITGFTRPLNVSLESVELRSWLMSIEDEIGHLLGEDSELRISTGVCGLSAIADPGSLHQAVLNIVLWSRDQPSNGVPAQIEISARKATPEDRKLGYLAGDAESSAVITLKIAGTSLDDRTKEHLFDPLFAARHGSGAGLGLAVVKQLIDAQRGRVFVDSDDRHTVFTICLRSATAEEPDSEQAPETSTAPTAPKSNTILLVEDDELVASGISALLEIDGQRVTIANRGQQAVEILEREKPAIVILDIGLPDMSGTEVFERAMEIHPDLPVVFSSGHGDHQELKPYLDRPNVEFLLKPYDAATLLAIVERLTGE